MRRRYKTWFTGLWDSRLGPEGAEYCYQSAVWSLRALGMLVVFVGGVV